MRKNSGLLIVIVLLLAACSIETTRKVKIEMPSVPEVRLDRSQEMIVTNFWLDKEIPDFGLNQNLVQYFQDELKRPFKGKLSTKTIAWENADLPKNKEFWKQAAGDAKDTLFLTGKIQFGQELRKALLANERRAVDDGPFAKETAWAERRNYSLKLEIFLILSDTGEVLFQREYQEQMNYANIKQSAEFAFFDLIQRIKPKLLRALFGTDRVQERYLLSK
jgi:hypothetical protein